MKYLILIMAAAIFAGFAEADAQSLSDAARKSRQRNEQLRAEAASRYNEVIDTWNADSYRAFLKDYPTGDRSTEIRRRLSEIEAWQAAKRVNTIAAYNKYITDSQYKHFKTEADATITELKRAAERQAWNRVVAIGTLDAYEKYLNENPSSAYKAEAMRAIKKLQSEADWQTIAQSMSADDFTDFAIKYPESNHADEAKRRAHELRGRHYFDIGQLDRAYDEFTTLNRSDIDRANHVAYDAAMEFHDYSQLSIYSTSDHYRSFINKYPGSQYVNEVSNMLAISEAKKLNEYDYDTSYNRVRALAKDEATRRRVETYIEKSKNERRESERRRKAWKREENGGSVMMGWTFFSGSYNVSDDDGPHNIDMALMLKFGNFNDWIQFAVGLQPGIVCGKEYVEDGYWTTEYDYTDHQYYDHYNSYTYSEPVAKFHMPAVAQLKLNLFKMSEGSRFFVHGMFRYNLIREKYMEPEMQWAAGFGFGWKHIDWSFYYSKGINSDYDIQQLGTSITWYWKL